jgi:hypothetical protein
VDRKQTRNCGRDVHPPPYKGGTIPSPGFPSDGGYLSFVGELKGAEGS